MVKKVRTSSASQRSADDEARAAGSAQFANSVRDSAQQIWQAGLGAFTRAQAEGSKAFESLVKEGVSIQRKTQAAAEERLSEATHRVTHMASDLSARASGQWDKLESIFEARVAKALQKLGVPSAREVAALIERIDALNAEVRALSAQSSGATAPAGAKKTPTRPTAARKATTGRKTTVASSTAAAAPTPAPAPVTEAKPAAKPARKTSNAKSSAGAKSTTGAKR